MGCEWHDLSEAEEEEDSEAGNSGSDGEEGPMSLLPGASVREGQFLLRLLSFQGNQRGSWPIDKADQGGGGGRV